MGGSGELADICSCTTFAGLDDLMLLGGVDEGSCTVGGLDDLGAASLVTGGVGSVALAGLGNTGTD